MSFLFNGIVIFIFIRLYFNRDVHFKWKLILTVLAVASMFFFNGIGLGVVAIIVFFVLKWNNDNIR
jgi:NADH:ubiquinone oxidoreductase subunit 2 (subunit N)